MKYKSILVTGGHGMTGKSLKLILPEVHYISSQECDLRDLANVERLFTKYQPDCIIHLAARVGGIFDNMQHPAEYFDDNILMNTNVIKTAKKWNVNRLITMLSSCSYPDITSKYPMKEEDMHLGPPAITNISYGYTKRAMAIQIDAYNKQYNTKYQYLIPSNLYGTHDKYGENSHFIAALIKKIHLAKINNEDKIILFGDGTPLRQFMNSDDLAYIIKYCIDNNIYEHMNVASEENLTIKEMAQIALEACDAKHLNIEFDSTKPNGQYRKDVSIEKLKKFIPHFNPYNLFDGIKKTYQEVDKSILES